MALQIISTADGSHSLLNTELNETYHSVHGAIQESVHIFITNGIGFFRQSNHGIPIRVLEIGFGTALNALLTAGFSRDNHTVVEYSSVESSPIDPSLAAQLNYPEGTGIEDAAPLFKKLHELSWGIKHEILQEFSILKRHERLQDSDLGRDQFDVVYFDAFAPGKQPDMWELPLLQKVFSSMKPNAVFVTYCAKGQVKRDLRSLGLTVVALPGPSRKKRKWFVPAKSFVKLYFLGQHDGVLFLVFLRLVFNRDGDGKNWNGADELFCTSRRQHGKGDCRDQKGCRGWCSDHLPARAFYFPIFLRRRGP